MKEEQDVLHHVQTNPSNSFSFGLGHPLDVFVWNDEGRLTNLIGNVNVAQK